MQNTEMFTNNMTMAVPYLSCLARVRLTIKIDTRLMMIWKRQWTWMTQSDRMTNRLQSLVLVSCGITVLAIDRLTQEQQVLVKPANR